MGKIILIADSDPRCQIVGGVGTYTAQLALQLSKKNTLLFIGKKQPGKHVAKVSYGVKLANSKPNQSNIQFLLALLKIGKKIETSEEDVIHAQRPDWLWAFRKHPGRKVITLHGSHSKNMAVKKGFLLQKLYLFLEKKGLSIADQILAVDHNTAQEFKEKFPSIEEKISVIPVGVDTKYFSLGNKRTARKKLNLPLNKKVFLYVGRLSEEKNIQDMIRNIRPDELLVIVGAGDKEDELRKLAQNKSVIFAGPKKQNELRDYYVSADALLLFSKHEGLPTVVLEGFACGLPVVATPVGEIPFLLSNSLVGLVVKKNNYRKCMDEILKKNELIKNDCRKKALSYDWEKIAIRIQKEAYNE